MLSPIARFDTISPAQYQKINQVGLLILISSAAFAPAWLNIVTVAGYAIMNWLTFKRLCISIIDSVLGTQPAPRKPSRAEIQAARWDAEDARWAEQRECTSNLILIGRLKPSLPAQRSYRTASRPKGGIKYE